MRLLALFGAHRHLRVLTIGLGCVPTYNAPAEFTIFHAFLVTHLHIQASLDFNAGNRSQRRLDLSEVDFFVLFLALHLLLILEHPFRVQLNLVDQAEHVFIHEFVGISQRLHSEFVGGGLPYLLQRTSVFVVIQDAEFLNPCEVRAHNCATRVPGSVLNGLHLGDYIKRRVPEYTLMRCRKTRGTGSPQM